MRGIEVTNGTDVDFARNDDFVLNTQFRGGLKVGETKIFIPKQDATVVSVNNYYQIIYPHRLDYVPAVIAFQNGTQGVGWQNSADIFSCSANADRTNVYLISDYFLPTKPIYLFIFQEKVADA